MLLTLKKSRVDRKVILLVIPLVLASFTHLWNVSGFPSFHPDEGVYIRRALHILDGFGVQDPSSKFDHSQDSTSAYDHPYFGPIFLASVFKLIGYPGELPSNTDVSSIQRLSTEPRVIMGILAIIDTFIVYMICERRYNSRVAIFASIIFAVMPLSWFSRRVVLDSIMLPFLLTSILLILQIRANPKHVQTLSILSGLCLGIAIFTKIPAFTFIPVLAFLILQSIKKEELPSINRIKILTVWLFPVILTPLIWPAYAYFVGDFGQWIDGILWQSSERKNEGKSFFDIADSAIKTDPVLLIVGTAGVIYLAVRREFFPLIWILPYVIFLILVGWVTHFHLIPIIPILSISIAKLVYDVPAILRIKDKIPASAIIVAAIGIFGLVTTTALISMNLTDAQFASVSYIASKLVPVKEGNTIMSISSTNQDNNLHGNQVTVISSPIFSWIYKYVLNQDNIFTHVRDTQPIKTQKLILLVDSTYKHVISQVEGENVTQVNRLNNIYNSTDIVALFKDDSANINRKIYPFTGLDTASIGSVTQEVRSN